MSKESPFFYKLAHSLETIINQLETTFNFHDLHNKNSHRQTPTEPPSVHNYPLAHL